MNSVDYVSIKALANAYVERFVQEYNIKTISSPCHILFLENFKANAHAFLTVFSDFNMQNNIYYSCKANKGKAFLLEASNQACGIEVSSIYVLRDALVYTNKIIASGPAKSVDYLKLAIKNNLIISVDDISELKVIASFNLPVKVLIRISNLMNKVSRFGVQVSSLDDCLEIVKASKIVLLGFSFHINNYLVEERIQAIYKILSIVQNEKIKIKYIDIGGGLPVRYCLDNDYEQFLCQNNRKMFFSNREIKDFYPYANKLYGANAFRYILSCVSDILNGIELIIEPGRILLADCGISIFNVYYLKELEHENVVVTDGNINCLSEQWFNSDYLIEPLLYKETYPHEQEPILASVAGNLCLEQDMITWRKLKFDCRPEYGDKLIYFNTAGYQMDSNESTFHKIPFVQKYIAIMDERIYLVKDEDYGSKSGT